GTESMGCRNPLLPVQCFLVGIAARRPKPDIKVCLPGNIRTRKRGCRGTAPCDIDWRKREATDVLSGIGTGAVSMQRASGACQRAETTGHMCPDQTRDAEPTISRTGSRPVGLYYGLYALPEIEMYLGVLADADAVPSVGFNAIVGNVGAR